MFQDLTHTLSRLHLKPKDATVYLTCLHFKEGLFVHELVKKTKINRSTVDLILQRLIETGFISKVKVDRRYKFFAQSLENILLKQEAIVADFRELLPLLSKLGTESGATEIRFFEGKKGILQIYDDMLQRLKFAEGDARQLVSFSGGSEVSAVFPDMQKKFIDKRIKIGVWYRAIVPHGALKISEFKENPKDLRAAKGVDDKKFPFKVTFETYADSVMIYSPKKPFWRRRHPQSSDRVSMRSLFYLVWGLLPDKSA